MALNSELPAGGERAPVFEHAPSSPTNHVFRLIDFDIDNFTLKMTFNHQNNIRNGLFSQNHIKHILHFLLFVFVKNHIFLYLWPWNWLFDLKDVLEYDLPSPE